jgi:hypothetical protein
MQQRSPEEIRQQLEAVREREITLLQQQIANLRRTLLCVPHIDARVRVEFFLALDERRLAAKCTAAAADDANPSTKAG